MKTNILVLNRVIRMIIGIFAIVGAFVFFPQLNLWALCFGAILIITGLIGFCPVDHYFHMNQHD